MMGFYITVIILFSNNLDSIRFDIKGENLAKALLIYCFNENISTSCGYNDSLSDHSTKNNFSV